MIDNRNGGKSNSLGLSDDYEDRVKMIITSELAREGDKKMSPVKDTKMMQVTLYSYLQCSVVNLICILPIRTTLHKTGKSKLIVGCSVKLSILLSITYLSH